MQKLGLNLLFKSFGYLFVFVVVVRCKTRRHFIAAIDVDWDFAPLGNVLNADQNDFDIFLKPSIDPPRVGKMYKKALLREFQDGSFSSMKARPRWLGVLGPIIRAEMNDEIVIEFWNNATASNLTLHPHGVLYEKDSEGALYVDGTSGSDKKDDGVPSGGRHTYHWHVDPRYGPTEDDPSCLTWAYHSHHYAERDINTGLVGAMVICKEGILNETSGERKDVDREFVLFYHVMDENKSWYIEENLKRIRKTDEDSAAILEEEDFQESNMMHAVNGFLYGNVLDIESCIGDTISWHLFSLGNEVDVHNVRFQGQTMLKRNRRSNFATLFPAKFVTLRSKVHFSGNWTINCEVYDHTKAGMQAVLTVDHCGKEDDFGEVSKKPPVRTYSIAAQELIWDYGPSGFNKLTGKPLEDDQLASVHFSKNDGHLGGRYWKAVYRQYEDDNFSAMSARDPHLGILGPVIRGEIGDIIKITFFNNASRPYSLMLNGAAVQLNASAIKYFGLEESPKDGDGPNVAPGMKMTSYWLITKDDENASLDESKCINTYYSSYVDLSDNYAGLMGIMLVCAKGSLGDNGIQKDVDKEYFLMLSNLDENESLYLDKNIAAFSTNKSVDKHDESFKKSNLMYSINGLMFNNLDGLEACEGDLIVWHTLSVGTESDVHVLHFDGLGVSWEKSHRDSVDLFPGVSRTFVMNVDSAGIKEINCRTTAHHVGGMQTRIDIKTCPGKNVLQPSFDEGKDKLYYIGVVEEEWDYAPNETHPIFGKNLQDLDESRIFVKRDATHIGKKYKKAMFREFSDSTFATRKPHSSVLGVLGPLIKAEVGNVVKITFKNMASRNYNIRAHGVLQNDDDDMDDGVGPNQTVEYTWKIAERSGPGKDDLNCITWAYSSTLDPAKDVNTGLVGPLVICRKGVLDQTGSRNDVHEEYALMFSVMDENNSWYLDDNIQNYCFQADKVDKEDPDFQESNLMHGINGYVYGNLKGLTLKENQPAAIYLIGFGNEVDIHTIHFHGETFVSNAGGKSRGDVKEVFPGTFETIELTPTNPGTWLLHCHVNDHMEAGMMTTYNVRPERRERANGTVPTAGRVLWSVLAFSFLCLALL